MTKKSLGITIAFAIFLVLAWVVAPTPHHTSISYAAVVEVIEEEIHARSGAGPIERRMTMDYIRGGTWERIFRKLTGRPLFDDNVEFRLTDGVNTTRVFLFHKGDEMGPVELINGAIPSSTAGNIQRRLKAAFPGIDCEIK